MHRKMTRMAAAGLFSMAVLSDCVVYPSLGPSRWTSSHATHTPASRCQARSGSGSRAGWSVEGARPFVDMVGLADAGANPARHIKETPQEGQDG